MPKTKVQKLPCPLCPYEAWSQVDLDGHLKAAHAGQGTPPAVTPPVAKAVPATPPPPAPVVPDKVEPARKPDAPAAQVETVAVMANVQASVPPAVTDKAESAPVKPVAKEEKPGLPPGIFVPAPLPDFWVADAVARELFVVAKLAKRGEVVNVKVVGPAGVGKTSLGWEFAAANHCPVFEVHWGMYQEPGEVWGRDRLDMEQGTHYEQARLVDALETPGCVIINDEPNRCHPSVLNAMFAIWDWRRAAWVPELRRMVKVAPGVVFFACMNEGGEYVGVNPLDKAIRERFGRTIRLMWPPQKEEALIVQRRTGCPKDIADKLTRFARDVRRNPKIGCAPSTRQLLVAAQDVAEGLPVQEAVLYAIVNDLDEGVDRTALLQHLQVIGKVDDAFVNGKDNDDDDR